MLKQKDTEYRADDNGCRLKAPGMIILLTEKTRLQQLSIQISNDISQNLHTASRY